MIKLLILQDSGIIEFRDENRVAQNICFKHSIPFAIIINHNGYVQITLNGFSDNLVYYTTIANFEDQTSLDNWFSHQKYLMSLHKLLGN